MSNTIWVPDILRYVLYLAIHEWRTPEGSPCQQWRMIPNAAAYATVNRQWRDIIESYTFEVINLTKDRFQGINSTINPRRRRYLRTINLDIVLPKRGDVGSDEPEEEKLQNNEVLQADLEAFLNLLSKWPSTDMHQHGVKLSIDAWAPNDPGRRECRSQFGTISSRWERKHRDSVLELIDYQKILNLPPVYGITQVERREVYKGRHIAGATLATLVAKFPMIKIASIEWWDIKGDSSVRRDFAKSIRDIPYPIEDLHISCHPYIFHGKLPIMSSWPPIGNCEDTDDLSQGIHELSQRLKTLDLYNLVISDELLYPRAVLNDKVQAHWFRLETFYTSYSPITPSGQWLFLPDYSARRPEDTESEETMSEDSTNNNGGRENYRHHNLAIATPAMQNFYLAAAHAALQMPVLKEMLLVASLELADPNCDNWHKFQYLVKNYKGTACWSSSVGFAPEEEVLDCWRRVPKKHHDSELDVILSSDENAI